MTATGAPGHGRPSQGRARAARAAWLILAALVAVALAVGAGTRGGAPTAAQRAEHIDQQLRCPSCEALSVAQSGASTAVAIRRIVRERVATGESDAEIKAFLASRYGTSILLTPPAHGVDLLVWLLPLAAVAAATASLAAFLVRRARVRSRVELP